jgi:hypothetical protein
MKRLPELALSLIEIESPMKAEQCDWLLQFTLESVTVAVPLPLTLAVIVTGDEAMWATGCAASPIAVVMKEERGVMSLGWVRPRGRVARGLVARDEAWPGECRPVMRLVDTCVRGDSGTAPPLLGV